MCIFVFLPVCITSPPSRAGENSRLPLGRSMTMRLLRASKLLFCSRSVRPPTLEKTCIAAETDTHHPLPLSLSLSRHLKYYSKTPLRCRNRRFRSSGIGIAVVGGSAPDIGNIGDVHPEAFLDGIHDRMLPRPYGGDIAAGSVALRGILSL